MLQIRVWGEQKAPALNNIQRARWDMCGSKACSWGFLSFEFPLSSFLVRKVLQLPIPRIFFSSHSSRKKVMRKIAGLHRHYTGKLWNTSVPIPTLHGFFPTQLVAEKAIQGTVVRCIGQKNMEAHSVSPQNAKVKKSDAKNMLNFPWSKGPGVLRNAACPSFHSDGQNWTLLSWYVGLITVAYPQSGIFEEANSSALPSSLKK